MSLAPSRRTASLGPSVMRQLLDARGPNAINLAIGEPKVPVPAELLDGAFSAYQRQPVGYTLNAGIAELRDLIAAHYRYPHLGGRDNVIVTVGASEGILATLIAVADPGDEIVVVEPAFWVYRTLAEILGIRVVGVPMRREHGFSIDSDAIAAALTPRTRAVVINSPSNPIGNVQAPQALAALVAATEAAGVWLIADEIYQELYYTDERPASLAPLTDRAIVISGLSKSCSMAGFRLGYVLAPQPLAKAITAVHQHSVACAPAISQYLALEVFRRPTWLAVNRPIYAAKRLVALTALQQHLGLPIAPADGAFYFFVDVSGLGMDSLTLARRLLSEADVVTVPGSAFGASGEGFLRVSYVEEDDKVCAALERMGRVFRGG